MSSPRQRPHFTSERQHDAYDEGWAAGRELVATSLQEAFRAGAEYVRGVSHAMGWINHPTTPPIVIAPTNEGITAAAEGYVSALAESASAGLECPHCGDVAYESPSGLFGDWDGVACMSCGHPGHVSVDEDEKGEAVAYWILGLGPCDDAQCHACDDERHAEARQ